MPLPTVEQVQQAAAWLKDQDHQIQTETWFEVVEYAEDGRDIYCLCPASAVAAHKLGDVKKVWKTLEARGDWIAGRRLAPILDVEEPDEVVAWAMGADDFIPLGRQFDLDLPRSYADMVFEKYPDAWQAGRRVIEQLRHLSIDENKGDHPL